jgi:hypothetical protein
LVRYLSRTILALVISIVLLPVVAHADDSGLGPVTAGSDQPTATINQLQPAGPTNATTSPLQGSDAQAGGITVAPNSADSLQPTGGRQQYTDLLRDEPPNEPHDLPAETNNHAALWLLLGGVVVLALAGYLWWVEQHRHR